MTYDMSWLTYNNNKDGYVTARKVIISRYTNVYFYLSCHFTNKITINV